MSTVAPYGTWTSPISAELVATAGLRLHDMHVDGDELYWSEDRPREGGRCVVCKLDGAGRVSEVIPEGFDVRSRVHEYGGGAWTVRDGTVFFSSFADQRLYRHPPGGEPVPITPAPRVPAGLRYADVAVSPDGAWLVCVRESHEGGEVRNDLVAVRTDGSTPARTLTAGRDFYAFPRLSPDGKRLAWVEWEHPRMPWDGSELKTAAFYDGRLVTEPTLVAGGREESIFQPEWSPEGVLHFVSDRSGWWNLYALDGAEAIPLAPTEAELGTTAWALGLCTYAFLPAGRVACLYARGPVERLGVIEPAAREVVPLDLPFSAFSPRLRAVGQQLVCIAGSPTTAPALTLVEPRDGSVRTLRSSHTIDLDPAYLSVPRQVDFPTGQGERAYALYYPPTNPRFRAPEGELPPLLVRSHGGPTAKVVNQLNLDIQFFASRGFAVAEVDYRGSCGRGRAYRQRLHRSWGLVDVEDCVNAARFLAARGLADHTRMAIRGRSSGGYTVLCALTFHDTFAAGVSYFGIADLEALALQTHKFESHYLDFLVGPYPEAASTYRERSPVHHAERLSRPLLILQGQQDRIVPPAQAQTMVRTLEARRVPYAYLAFESEQHGFRSAASIVRATEAELSFYSRILGFQLTDPVEPITIRHFDSKLAARPRDD